MKKANPVIEFCLILVFASVSATLNAQDAAPAPHGAPAAPAPAAPDTYTITVPTPPGKAASAVVGVPITVTVQAMVPGTPPTPDKNLSAPFTVSTTDSAQVVKPAGSTLSSGSGTAAITFSTVGGQTIYVLINGVIAASAPIQVSAAVAAAPAAAGKNKNYDLCNYRFNDCDWKYTVTGGGEESALSSQDSQTNAFVSLFVRGPWNLRSGSAWSLVRFLGAANANNTNNVVSAYTTATGSSSSSGLPQVGTALDYAIGYEHDWFHPGTGNPDGGQFTIGAIVAFGATTPLSAQHATTAYVVPAWGTNECSELISRFSSSAGPSGLPAQPSSPYITTTVTPASGSPTTTSAGPYCIINNMPITTTSSTGTTVVSGTAQTDIAFAPEDRNSFLLKYMAGLRLITRESAPNATFSRGIVDLTVGQDEAITGGLLRHFVAKTDVDFPIPNTSVHFFGSAGTRFSRNKYQSPLILQPATIVASSPTPPSTIIVPSTTTWVLPLTQPNRDFYRIGLGIDLTSVLAKVLKSTGQ